MGRHNERWTENDYEAYLRSRKSPASQTGSVITAAGRPPSATELRLRLPIPPGINCMYANAPGKGRVLTKVARGWKQNAILLIKAAAHHQCWYYSGDLRLRLTIVWHFATDASDIDGPLKIVMDSLAAACGFNDKVIDDLRVSRGVVEPNGPNCEVRLNNSKEKSDG